MRRFDHEYAQLKALIDGGEFGVPLVMHCAHRNPAVPHGFDSEMMVRDSLVHEVDVTRFLFGEEITSIHIVKPTANPAAPEGLQDPQIAILRTESGRHVDVELFVTTGVAYEVRTEVVGEKGSAMIGLDMGLVRKAAPGRWGGVITPSFRERFGQAYDTEIQRWVDAVRAGANVDGPGGVGRLRRRRGVRGGGAIAGDRPTRRRQDGHPRLDKGRHEYEDRPGSHAVPPRLRAARIPPRGSGSGLRVPPADAASGFHPVLQPPPRRRRPGGQVPQGVRRRRRGDRLGAAGTALVGPRRGRPRSRGAQLETRRPDHRRSRRERDQHRVLRAPRTRRGIRAGVLPVHGGAGADLRARRHRRAHRPAPRRFRRGRAGGVADHPRRQLAQHRHGRTSRATPSTWAAA